MTDDLMRTIELARTTELTQTMTELITRGRGILAADESIATMSDRLQRAGVAPTTENRRAYRELLVTTPGLSDGVTGVILCEETLRQSLSDDWSFADGLAMRGLLAGVKVDTGARPLAGAPGETITEGLDGLRERLAEYAALGARFAKWRAVLRIGEGQPSWHALQANAHALARYAALCQEAAIVPVVEPEVLMTGTHPMRRCRDVTAAALMVVFAELQNAQVRLDALVLKPNMVVPGERAAEVAAPEQVAAETVAVLRDMVPDGVAGIAFLSGGQDPVTATMNLAAIADLDVPWPITFSFGRALVDPALSAWHGDPRRVAHGQRELADRVVANAAALALGRGSLVTRT
jgi:fructose-bisphosphate aldolase, class I